MKPPILNVFCVLALASTVSSAQTNYLCAPVRSTGFELRDGEWEVWETDRFEIDKERFVLRQSSAEESDLNAEWVVLAESNESIILATCDRENSAPLGCDGPRTQWLFDLEALRFQYWYIGGYVLGNADASGLAIGKCVEREAD